MKQANDSDIEEISEQNVQEIFNEDLRKELEEAALYNQNIREHLDCYKNFVPNNPNEVLIRIYRRAPIVLQGGLVLDDPGFADFAQVTKVAGSGQSYQLKEQMSAFKLSTKAVVVSHKDSFSQYSIGQEVNIHPLQTKSHKIEDTVYSEYQYQYMDADSGFTFPPSDCSNPHFGYAIIPSHIIRGHVEVK